MLCKANPTYMKIKIGNVEIVHALRKAHTHNTSTRTHTRTDDDGDASIYAKQT